MPWRSRWSGSRFRSTAIAAVKRVDVLELERRELADDPRVGRAAPTRLVSGRPMLPATSAGTPAAVEHRAEQRRRRRLAVRPGDPDIGFGEQPRSELDLRDDRDAASRAARTGGASAGTPGLLTTSVDAVEQRVAPTRRARISPSIPSTSRSSLGVVADDVGCHRALSAPRPRAAGARQPDDENAVGDLRHAASLLERSAPGAHARCAIRIPPTIRALPTAIGIVTFSPRTIAARTNRRRAAGTAASRSARCRRDRGPSTSRCSRGSRSRPRGRRRRPTPVAPASGMPSRARERRWRAAPTRRAEEDAPERRREARETAGWQHRARDVAGRDAERRGEHEQVAGERRIGRERAAAADQHDLADESDGAPGEPRAGGRAARDERGIGAREDRQRCEDHHPVQRPRCAAARRCRRPGRRRSRPPPRCRAASASPGPTGAAGASRRAAGSPEAGEDRPQAGDDERRQVVEREPRQDRGRAPDHHHADRDCDRDERRRARAKEPAATA